MKKVTAVAVRREIALVDAEELGEAFGEPVAAGELREHLVRVGVLLVDPGPCFGALLVLEPAVGIGDRDAVQRFGHRTDLRRGPRDGQRGGNGAGGENGGEDEQQRLSRHGSEF